MIEGFLKEPIKLIPKSRSEVFHELIQNGYVVVRTTRITPRTIGSTKAITISIQLPLQARSGDFAHRRISWQPPY